MIISKTIQIYSRDFKSKAYVHAQLYSEMLVSLIPIMTVITRAESTISHIASP